MWEQIKMDTTVDGVIETLGFNRFSFLLILITGFLHMGERSELNLISIVSPYFRCEWRLSILQASIQSSAVFVGIGIGNLFWGYLSDNHGRKHALILGSLLAIYFGLLSSVSPTVESFILSRFFVGVGLGCVGFGINYIAEFIRMKDRGKSIILVQVFFSLGSIYVAVMAFLIVKSAGWRPFLITATIPPICFVLLSPYLPESVRYLQNTGRYHEIIKILSRISNYQPIAIPKVTFDCRYSSKRGNIMLLLHTEYRVYFFVMIIYFITSQLCYYGVVMLNTELLYKLGSTNGTTECYELDNGDYLQNMIVSLGEIPGTFTAAFLVDTIGRRKYIAPCFLLAAILFQFLNLNLGMKMLTVLMFSLRFLIIGVSQSAYILAVELFPTVVRTTALGIFLGASKFSLIAVPFLSQSLLHGSVLATSLIFTGLCFVTAILVLLLPETKNSVLINA